MKAIFLRLVCWLIGHELKRAIPSIAAGYRWYVCKRCGEQVIKNDRSY